MKIKVPFDYGFLDNALLGALGREPDKARRYGDSGHYEWHYIPKTEVEKNHFMGQMPNICRWIKIFDLEWPDSYCEYGVYTRMEAEAKWAGEGIHILVKHEVVREVR